MGNVNARMHPETLEIVVEASASKTRAIIYKLSTDSISPVVEHTLKIPLSSYGNTPNEANTKLIAPLLKELITSAKNKGYALEENNIRVNVLGAAGMRKLSSSQQQSIYQHVKEAINDKGFITGQVRTIEGWEQGVFSWAHLNKLKGLMGSDNMLGIIDIGSSSSQITFAGKDSNFNGSHPVQWQGKTYHLLSESLLGLDAKDARDAMNKSQQQNINCYPEGFAQSSGFDFTICNYAYNKAITSSYKSEYEKLKYIASVVNSGDIDFVGLSGLYYLLNFFNNDKPAKGKLKTALKQSCSSMEKIEDIINQDQSKDQFESENKCADGVFVYNFLYNYLRLKDGQLTAIKKIDNMDIRWTEGFLLLNKESN